MGSEVQESKKGITIMKNKISTISLVITSICATIIFFGSIGAYEKGCSSWYEFFWQITSSILMYMLVLSLVFARSVLKDYTEVCKELEEFEDELDCYLIEEAEEVIIPEEEFEFTRTPELED